jgi:hypothetical protein
VVKGTKKASPKKARASTKDLFPERLVPTAKMMEAWHKNLARASGMLSLTLSRRRLSPSLIAEMLELIDPTVEEMRRYR